MKILLFILISIFSKFGKTSFTISGVMLANKYYSQSYTSGNRAGFNTWGIFIVNSPGNTYTNSVNAFACSKDSATFFQSAIRFDSLAKLTFTVPGSAHFMFLDDRRLKHAPFSSIPLSSAQVISALTYTPLQTEVDGNTTNEIQTLSGTGTNTISLSLGGGTFAIPTQTVSTSIVGAGINNVTGTYPSFTITGTEVDGSTTNEIQSLSLNGQSVSISSGNTIVIPTQTVATTITGGGINVVTGTHPSFTVTGTEVDGSVTNEIQTLSGSGTNTINLSSGGGSFVIPSGSTLTGITASTGISVTNGSVITNTIPDRTVAITGTGLNVTSSYPNFTLAVPSRTFNNVPGRALSTTGTNNTFVISSTNDSRVNYTIDFSVALIAALSNGVVTLDYSMDGTNWTTISSVSQVFGVAVSITTSGNTNLSGEIPANARVRINRTNNTNCTVTLVRQQEVTY